MNSCPSKCVSSLQEQTPFPALFYPPRSSRGESNKSRERYLLSQANAFHSESKWLQLKAESTKRAYRYDNIAVMEDKIVCKNFPSFLKEIELKFHVRLAVFQSFTRPSFVSSRNVSRSVA